MTSLTPAQRPGAVGASPPKPREASADVATKVETKAPDAAASNLPERRHAMIAEAAYFRAEMRNFEPGHELDDWLAAEAAITSAAAAQQTAKR